MMIPLLLAESKEELKSFLMRVKEKNDKAGLKLNIQKTKIIVSSPITSWQIEGKKWQQWQTIFLTKWTFVGKLISLLLNMLSRLVITFLPRSKRLLISWLQSPSVMILEPRKIKSDTVSTVSPSISHEVMGPDAMSFVFWMLSFKQALSLSSRSSLVPFHFLPLEWYHLHIWGCWYFSLQSWFQLVIHPAQHFTWCILHKS